tara:strand:- start:20 stop:526 length:507 start_codon:yes stop_codon:yes gene_type:complete
MATNLQLIKEASGTNVTTLSVTDCFGKGYDVYQVILNAESDSTDGYWGLQLIDNSGSTITGSEYDEGVLLMRSYGSFIDNYSATASMVSAGYDDDYDAALTLYVYNPDDSGSYTFGTFATGGGTGSGLIGTKGIFVHHTAEVISGIHFKMSAGSNDFDYINVSVYGVK